MIWGSKPPIITVFYYTNNFQDFKLTTNTENKLEHLDDTGINYYSIILTRIFLSFNFYLLYFHYNSPGSSFL